MHLSRRHGWVEGVGAGVEPAVVPRGCKQLQQGLVGVAGTRARVLASCDGGCAEQEGLVCQVVDHNVDQAQRRLLALLVPQQAQLDTHQQQGLQHPAHIQVQRDTQLCIV